ncbi:putative cystine transporter YijE [bacterium HR23]|nr:putative cystine transporter YijE [bacterium HR23]
MGKAPVSAPARRGRGFVVAQLLLVVLFWASTFPVSKVALGETTPFLLAGLRYAVSGALLGLWWGLAFRPPAPQAPSSIPWGGVFAFALSGVVGFNAFFYLGLKQSTAVNGSLIQPTAAAMGTALLAWMLLGERLAGWRYLAFPLATAGVALVILGDPARQVDPSSLVGNLFFLLGGTSFALSNIVGRRLFQRTLPLQAVALANSLGAVILLLLAVGEGGWSTLPHASWRLWAIVGYMGAFATGIGYLWWYEGVRRLGATRTGVFTFLVPVVGAFLSVAFLGEPFHPLQMLGGVLALLGVGLVLL